MKDDLENETDEHKAIAGLTGTLTGGSSNLAHYQQVTSPFDVVTPQSPAQLVLQIDSAQRQEFEALKRRLEDEQR